MVWDGSSSILGNYSEGEEAMRRRERRVGAQTGGRRRLLLTLRVGLVVWFSSGNGNRHQLCGNRAHGTSVSKEVCKGPKSPLMVGEFAGKVF